MKWVFDTVIKKKLIELPKSRKKKKLSPTKSMNALFTTNMPSFAWHTDFNWCFAFSLPFSCAKYGTCQRRRMKEVEKQETKTEQNPKQSDKKKRRKLQRKRITANNFLLCLKAKRSSPYKLSTSSLLRRRLFGRAFSLRPISFH